MLLDTESALISGFGDINLRDERLDYTLRTEPKHFTVGALSTDILIRGPFSGPSVLPEPVELGARAGAAVGLGLLFFAHDGGVAHPIRVRGSVVFVRTHPGRAR